MAKIRISQSSIRAWRRCRLAFNYRYVEHLQERKLSRPLTFGKAVHTILEYDAQGKSMDEALRKAQLESRDVLAAEMDDFHQMMQDARDIMTAYFHYWHKVKKEPFEFYGIKEGKETRYAEFEFEHDIGNGVVLEGIIDCIPETPDGRLWIGEHKSHKGERVQDDLRMNDLQGLLYADAAVKALGLRRVAGTLWDNIRSKTPAIPKLLKKTGEVSKASIDTLPHVFERSIKELGLDPKHYSDKLGELDEGLSKWFTRVKLPLHKSAVEAMVEETQITGREMIRKAGVDKTRNLGKDCSWCGYARLCHAELMGHDADHIREREYKVKVSKNIVEPLVD